METSKEAIIDTIFLMAWKDGQITPQEKTVLKRMLMRLQLPIFEIDEIIEERTQQPPTVQSYLDQLGDDASRRQAMLMTLAVCFSDKDLDPKELDYVAELAQRLGYNAGDLEQLRAEAEELVIPEWEAMEG